MKLKNKEKAEYRAKLLKEQGGICPLCEEEIEKGSETLDHDHDTGHCRRVLHRSCNGSEGRIKSWAKRSNAKDYLKFLRNLVKYLESDYSTNPIHPSHLDDIDKEIMILKKKKTRVKTERAKQRYNDRIKTLKESKNG